MIPGKRLTVSGRTALGGGWTGAALGSDPGRWRVPLPDDVGGELVALARKFVDTGAAFDPFAAAVPHSDRTAALVDLVRDRLTGHPGFVVLTGFPVGEPQEVVAAAYWLFGRLIGPPVSQTRDGDLLVRVEDRGADTTSPTQRGHRSADALAFHADRTDVIGLLCIRPARHGGLSRLVSSETLHDTVLAERPDLLDVLYAPLPNDQRGEAAEGRPGWCTLPVFSREDGDFAARYLRRFVTDSQRHPDAPRLTDRQTAAMDLLDDVLERPGTALEMELRPGDLQLIDNFRILHARSAFSDAADRGPGRLLLRLWLSSADSPTLPAEYADLYGETAGGAYRGGVWPPGAAAARRNGESGHG